jgi:hypothetical protein
MLRRDVWDFGRPGGGVADIGGIVGDAFSNGGARFDRARMAADLLGGEVLRSMADAERRGGARL